MNRAVKITTAICIACVAIQAIIWIAITSFDREQVVPAPRQKPDTGE